MEKGALVNTSLWGQTNRIERSKKSDIIGNDAKASGSASPKEMQGLPTDMNYMLRVGAMVESGQIMPGTEQYIEYQKQFNSMKDRLERYREAQKYIGEKGYTDEIAIDDRQRVAIEDQNGAVRLVSLFEALDAGYTPNQFMTYREVSGKIYDSNPDNAFNEDLMQMITQAYSSADAYQKVVDFVSKMKEDKETIKIGNKSVGFDELLTTITNSSNVEVMKKQLGVDNIQAVIDVLAQRGGLSKQALNHLLMKGVEIGSGNNAEMVIARAIQSIFGYETLSANSNAFELDPHRPSSTKDPQNPDDNRPITYQAMLYDQATNGESQKFSINYGGASSVTLYGSNGMQITNKDQNKPLSNLTLANLVGGESSSANLFVPDAAVIGDRRLKPSNLEFIVSQNDKPFFTNLPHKFDKETNLWVPAMDIPKRLDDFARFVTNGGLDSVVGKKLNIHSTLGESVADANIRNKVNDFFSKVDLPEPFPAGVTGDPNQTLEDYLRSVYMSVIVPADNTYEIRPCAVFSTIFPNGIASSLGLDENGSAKQQCPYAMQYNKNHIGALTGPGQYSKNPAEKRNQILRNETRNTANELTKIYRYNMSNSKIVKGSGGWGGDKDHSFTVGEPGEDNAIWTGLVAIPVKRWPNTLQVGYFDDIAQKFKTLQVYKDLNSQQYSDNAKVYPVQHPGNN